MVRLALVAMLAGCLIKPDKLGDNENMVPRVVGKAFWNDGSQTGSPGMRPTGYAISVDGPVLEGDLLLLVGNIDNDPLVPPPDANFDVAVTPSHFGADGQTYFAFKRLATATETSEMMGTYMGGPNGSSTFLLIAITGASESFQANAEEDSCTGSEMDCGSYDVVEADSSGVPTQAGDIVIYAAGVDWQDTDMPITFNPPDDYTVLDAFTDRDDNKVRWTSMMVAYTRRDTAPAKPIAGSFDSPGNKGQFWAAALPIHPK